MASSPSLPCRDCPPESAGDLPGWGGQPAAGPVHLRGADPASGPRRAAPGPATQTQVPLPAHTWTPLPRAASQTTCPGLSLGIRSPTPTPTFLPGWLLPLTALDRGPCLHAQIWGPLVPRRADSQGPSLHPFFWLHLVIPESGHRPTPFRRGRFSCPRVSLVWPLGVPVDPSRHQCSAESPTEPTRSSLLSPCPLCVLQPCWRPRGPGGCEAHGRDTFRGALTASAPPTPLAGDSAIL